MTLARWLLALVLTSLAPRVYAQNSATDAGPAEAGAPQALRPPVPQEMPPIALPPDSPALTEAVQIEVVLTIDDHGAVTQAEVTRSGGPALDRAVVDGVKRFRFSPALMDGAPVTVRVPFTQRFEPPPPPVVAPGPDAVLEGQLVTRGSRMPVVGATVAAVDAVDHRVFTATTDARGSFTLPVPGDRRLDVRVDAADYQPFVQIEQVAPHQHLTVKYLVDRTSYDQYESYVRAEAERSEVSRTTLSGREATHVPGTFADPMRVLNVLPGVSSAMSLLTLPIVRGSSPGTTGFLLDGVRLPLLFHLLAGPSVVHPAFLDHVDFHPGGFPVEYGGYIGGVLDARTKAERSTELHREIDLNLVQTGVMVREPLPSVGMTATVAARIGYPGLLLSLLASDVSLSYWDYQARVEGGRGPHRWSLFSYGAHDAVATRHADDEPLSTDLSLTFHRLDARYQHGRGDSYETARLVLGYESTLLRADDASGNPLQGNHNWSVNPLLRLHRSPAAWFSFTAGLESSLRTLDLTGLSGEMGASMVVFNPRGFLSTSSAFLETVWKLGERVRVIPGVRGDLYDERRSPSSSTALSIDPRLLMRVRLSGTDRSGVTLKGVVGRYHQPPRLLTALPALDSTSVSYGLLASTQFGLGLETKLGPAADLDVQGYYNDMDPVFMDLKTPDSLDLQPAPTTGSAIGVQPPPRAESQTTLDLFTKRRGRSYGMEVLLRRRDADRLFGWIAYTLSWSDRVQDGQWLPFDFDRRHILNAVAGWRLPRNWEIGARILYQTGTPLTTIEGRNRARSDGQFRFDLRFDKRAVWNDWLLDFYVDIINNTVAQESGGLVGATPIRYVLPTVGFRGVF